MFPIRTLRGGCASLAPRRSASEGVMSTRARRSAATMPCPAGSSAPSRRWAVAATLRFESEGERYRWLENALGVWEGEFDAEAHRARYRAYLVRNGLKGDQR